MHSSCPVLCPQGFYESSAESHIEKLGRNSPNAIVALSGHVFTAMVPQVSIRF